MLRRSPRVLVLWAAALAVAIVTAIVVASDLATLHRRATSLGPEVAALVARHDLHTGTELGRSDVAVREVHRSQVPPGTLVDRADARGRVVAVPVLRGGFLAARNLAPRSRTGLDGVVPEGMRAMRIDTSNALALRAGAAVDVFASYTSGAGSAGSAGATEVVAAGALVLDSDHDRAGGTGREGIGVTLLVDAREARDLADAQANGVLTIALVAPEEAARPARHPT